ncbi:MAG: S8 family serine peptidase [Tannerellaceae bacterium]|jgi:subtilisin family serine protease|nr:S8 family serine peptidase [Tannerellaceae bacterium]
MSLSVAMQSGESFYFRLYLKDKGPSGYSIENPEAFLSPAAVSRRQKDGIRIDASDLPVARAYLDTLGALGARPVVTSKWFSTVVVESADSALVRQLQTLPMVDSVKWVWKGNRQTPPGGTAGTAGTVKDTADTARLFPTDPPQKSLYGYAETQINMLDGIRLHQAGYRGSGMRVAVIDAGFRDADRMAVFDSLRLEGTYNVVSPGESVFSDDEHGTKVLSCLAANAPGVMIGTAPEASYWLIKSEDGDSEYPVEEDYWTAAVEFADSAGVQVVSSSLGYFAFDDQALSYHPAMLDGETAFISRAARTAAHKGLLVFVSAGNEGNGNWRKLTFPADVPQVVTVGAVTAGREKSVFSSTGFTADNRVKPDVVALGTHCAVIDGSGSVGYSSGTSFATPIVAGLGVCLWQALPQLSNLEMIRRIQRSASHYNQPDAERGYGIPNLYNAYRDAHENTHENAHEDAGR